MIEKIREARDRYVKQRKEIEEKFVDLIQRGFTVEVIGDYQKDKKQLYFDLINKIHYFDLTVISLEAKPEREVVDIFSYYLNQGEKAFPSVVEIAKLCGLKIGVYDEKCQESRSVSFARSW